MDTLSIILIAVCVSCIAAALYFWKQYSSSSANSADAQKQIAELEAQVRESVEKCSAAEKAHEEATNKISQANAQIKELEQKCEQAVLGNVDDEVKAKFGEVDKLKKKIKDLEGDVEDLEDDLDEANKSLNKKKTECSELEDSLDNEKRENKKISEELKRTQNELEEKKEELAIGTESLCFVQEVLKADPADDKNTTKLYAIVDELANFIKEEKLLPPGSDASDLDYWCQTQKKSWIQGKTTIAFVGEFSAGKTSIVNRILSQDDPNIPKLPVSTKATTAIPTYISGGVGTSYQFFTPDNVLKLISETTFKRVTKEVLDQVNGVSNLIQYFVMAYKNQNLNRLSILDTPGFNSGDKEDAERTLGVINECDALFWVFDVNAGTVNRSSIELIKKNLKRPLYVVINKVDTKSSSEVGKVENLIKKTLADAGLSVEKFIRFSGKEPLSSIMDVIKSVKHESGRDEYLRNVQEYIDQQIKDINIERDKKHKAYNKTKNESDILVERYNNLIGSVGNQCVEAANIPHFEEHLFRKDGYEMSIADYNRMTKILNDLCSTQMKNFRDLYNEQMKKRQELQSKWEEYLKMVILAEKTENIKKTFARKATPFLTK